MNANGNAFKRKCLLNATSNIKNSDEKRKKIEGIIYNEIQNDDEDVQKNIKCFWVDYNRRWKKAQRKPDKFESENADWLEGFVTFNQPAASSSVDAKIGRPLKDFTELSDRSKRLRTKDLRENYSTEELVYATQMSLRSNGETEAANMLKNRNKIQSRITSDQALAVFIDSRLTQRGYQIIREHAQDSYPPYRAVLEAKKRCYPASIQITETECTVKLQTLLDHTATRIVARSMEDIVSSASGNKSIKLEMVVKYGLDGSGGFVEYKQKFSTTGNSDSNIFLTSLVPLCLLNESEIVWNNPAPNSTRYCRPVRLQNIKESSEVIMAEYNRMSAEIDSLSEFSYEHESHTFLINYKVHLTMADGKVVNAITQTKSAQRCYLCGITCSHFNRLKDVPINEEFLKFSVGSLHCLIRSFECIVHIAYRLEFKKWQKTGHEDLFEATKKRIQEEFFEKLGLHVDKPRSNFGNSNDGNTARSFFENHKISAEITRVDENLIKRIRTILIALSCRQSIDPEKYNKFARETAELYVELYPWYNMPTTLHKMLAHGHHIILASVLPVGTMCEEAQEALNKEIRRIRRDHSRKTSRSATMEDVFNGLLVASDPLISSYRKAEKRKTVDLPEEVKTLLVEQLDHEEEEQLDHEEEENSESELSD